MIYLLGNSAFDSTLEILTNPWIIIGIVLSTIGLALAFLSKRIVQSIRKSEEIPNNDGWYIGLRFTSLILIVVAIVLVVLNA